MLIHNMAEVVSFRVTRSFVYSQAAQAPTVRRSSCAITGDPKSRNGGMVEWWNGRMVE